MIKATRQELEALAANLESRIQYEIAACESVGRSPSILFSLDELRAILCLAAHAGEQKPVAYLYRWNIGGEILTWRVSEDRQKVPASFDGIEEIPLYLNPAPTSVGAMREALERAAEGWTNAIELGLLPPQHVMSATILRDEALAALAAPPHDVVEGIARHNRDLALEFCKVVFQASSGLSDERTRVYAKIIAELLDNATDYATAILASGLVTAADEVSYRNAIDEALVIRHLGVAKGDAKDELNLVIDWEVAVALDPAVSEKARALEAAIMANERERCARVAERTPLNSYDAGECRADIAAAIRAGGAK